jgi:hypothetical protein
MRNYNLLKIIYIQNKRESYMITHLDEYKNYSYYSFEKNLKSYPANSTVAKGETFIGPFTITTSTDKVDTRARARLASIQIESDGIDDNWRYGIFRMDSQPDGRR